MGSNWWKRYLLAFCLLELAAYTYFVNGFSSRVGKNQNRDFSKNGEPIQLVKPDETHSKFLLDTNSLEILRKIESPIAIISAVGSIHTGKSFLMNQLLGSNSGFEVAYTVDPGTTGIWMWSEPIIHNKARKSFYSSSDSNDSVAIIILDTEGFHGPNVTKSYDQTLYAIASLLSTEVLFVTNKMIDSRDLEYLEELTKGANLFALRAYSKSLAKNIEAGRDLDMISSGNLTSFDNLNVQIDQDPIFKKKVDSAAIIDSLSPSSLTWVVQDFIQDLENKTPLQWLDNLIDSIPRSTPRNSSNGIVEGPTPPQSNPNHNTKHSLREMYETINCLTFPAPANFDEMQKLDLLKPENLSKEFTSQMKEFRESLFNRALSNFKCSGKSNTRGHQSSNLISGSDLADLLQFLVKAANENYFDDVGIFINQFLQVRADVIKNDLKRLYDSAMSAFLNSYPPPLMEEVSAYELKLYNRTLGLWSQHTLGDSDKDWAHKTQQSLIELLREGKKEYIETAHLLIKNYCKKHSEVQLAKEIQLISEKKEKSPYVRKNLDQWASNQFSKAKEALQNSINQQGKNYSTTTSCDEEIKQFSNEIEKLQIKFKAENNEAIAARFDFAKKSGVKKFKELIHDKQNFMIFRSNAEKFNEILFEWKLRAFYEFNSIVGDLIVMESEISDAKSQLEIDLKPAEEEAERMWDKECNGHCQDLISRWQNTFKNKLFADLIFPVEDEKLTLAIDTLVNLAKSEFTDSYCAFSRIWKENFEKFQSILNQLRKELENENIEAIKYYFKEPLEFVLDSLSIEANRYSLWKSFSEMAAFKAKKAILQNIEPKDPQLIISSSLVEKVIVDWTDKELVVKFQATIAKNFQDVIWKIGGGGLMISGLTSVLFFQYTLIGLVLFTIGIYSVLGSKLISELLRRAFQGSITYFFNLLIQWFGFEITCVLIVTIIILGTIYALYHLGVISTEKQEFPYPSEYYKSPPFQENRVHQRTTDPRIFGHKPNPMSANPYH